MSQSETRALLPDWHRYRIAWKVSTGHMSIGRVFRERDDVGLSADGPDLLPAPRSSRNALERAFGYYWTGTEWKPHLHGNTASISDIPAERQGERLQALARRTLEGDGGAVSNYD